MTYTVEFERFPVTHCYRTIVQSFLTAGFRSGGVTDDAPVPCQPLVFGLRHSRAYVIPAQAGIQCRDVDSRLCGNDGQLRGNDGQTQIQVLTED